MSATTDAYWVLACQAVNRWVLGNPRHKSAPRPQGPSSDIKPTDDTGNKIGAFSKVEQEFSFGHRLGCLNQDRAVDASAAQLWAQVVG